MKAPTWLALAALSIPVFAADDDAAARKDRTSVLALQGKPCGEVTKAERKGENDYIATCKDGNRYRVYTKDGRVLIEKQ